MKSVSFAYLHEHLDEVMDVVARTGEPVSVRRRNRRPVVMVNKADYASMMETIHLLSAPANGLRLLKAIKDVETGDNCEEHDLID